MPGCLTQAVSGHGLFERGYEGWLEACEPVLVDGALFCELSDEL